MNIVILGPKGAGKSTVGKALAERIGWDSVDTDRQIEAVYAAQHGSNRTCREIFTEHGDAFFRELEKTVALQEAARDWHVVITGGSLMLQPESRRALRADGLLIYLTAPTEVLWQRGTANGIPPWLQGPDGPSKFAEQAAYRYEVLVPFADIILDTADGTPEVLAEQLTELIGTEMSVRMQAGSTFGEIIRVTTFGESHGPGIGAVLEGVKPGIPVSEDDIQKELDRRRPGQSKIVTTRKEDDRVHILSGVFEGKTTGAPIGMVIYNSDQKSQHYDNLRDLFRPGHADFGFYKKYGIRDHRGGGRSSGRETACRVAAGAIAKQILAERGVRLFAHAIEIGGITVQTCNHDVIESTPVRCADLEAAAKMEETILLARKNCESIGGIVQLDILGVPVGLGDPVFAKLDARLGGRYPEHRRGKRRGIRRRVCPGPFPWKRVQRSIIPRRILLQPCRRYSGWHQQWTTHPDAGRRQANAFHRPAATDGFQDRRATGIIDPRSPRCLHRTPHHSRN